MLRQYTRYETTGEEYHNSAGTEEGRRPYLGTALLIAALLILFSGDVIGQKNTDLGLLAGTSYYMGDINKTRHFYNPSMAVGALYRYNFNPHNSLRFSAFWHKLSGSTLDFPDNFSPNVQQDFAASFVDLALNFEFNWKPYQTAHRKTVASPYVFMGLGYGFKLNGDAEVSSHLTFPFGAGYKINLGRWLSAGLEVGPRRAFSDMVDGVTNPGLDAAIAPMGNRDWYIFTGAFVTYKIFKLWDDCPTYEEGVPRKRKR
ncbi:DUF6089 family protein [Bacteroidota bacterium]